MLSPKNNLRQILLKCRRHISLIDRMAADEIIKTYVNDIVERCRPTVLGCYWPLSSEYDCREHMALWHQQGFKIALPHVAQRQRAFEFREWAPDCEMGVDIMGVASPLARVVCQPDMLLVPLVGFDARGYRIGYGGGYYDRTLSQCDPKPYCVGLGYACLQTPDAYPEPHDQPMQTVVTERGVWNCPRVEV